MSLPTSSHPLAVGHRLRLRNKIKRSISRVADQAVGALRRTGIGPAYRAQIAEHRPNVPGWPKAISLRVAALADLHYGGHYFGPSQLATVIDQTKSLEPDLIVLLGDYGASHLEGLTHRSAMRDLAASLSRLQAPLGVFAIIGNHDWWDDPNAQQTGSGPVIAAQELALAGICVLENEAVRLSYNGQPFWLAGLGDHWAHLGPPTTGDDDLPGLTAQLTDDAPAILLAHEPDIFPEVPSRYALTLSGHTHAGQIKLLGRTPVVPSQYGSRYVHGHIVETGRHLIVSAGLGATIVPMRIGAAPEILNICLGLSDVDTPRAQPRA